jgi:acyl-coenzyme A thioesterase PaaI-like protein
MVVSENVLKWAMRLYPPLFFQRIWVVRFDKNFRGVKVKINKSLINNNYNNSIFGGTIFAAADPFYPLLFHQLLAHRGYKLRVWMKSAAIQYLKPGHKDLFFTISIAETEIEEVEQVLKSGEKYIKEHPIMMYDSDGELCVEMTCEVYIRNLNQSETKDSVSI